MYYGLLLVSSISTVCFSFAGILKWGEKPIIRTYWSLFFLKIFFFLLTKFVIQAYILSIPVKSLMFNVALQGALYDVYEHPAYQLFELYYRGIDRHYYNITSNQTIYDAPELLTFTQATLYSPLVFLGLLFLPTFIYVLVISFRKFGFKGWFEKFVENAILSVFSVVTNLSFFKKENIGKPGKEITEQQKSQSLPELTSNPAMVERMRTMSLQNWPNTQIQGSEHNFSMFQSNFLYSLYFIGSAIILIMDLGMQIIRCSFSNNRLVIIGIFLVNIMLWIDFNFQFHRQITPISRKGIFDDIMEISNDALVCVVIAPFYWCSGHFRQ